MKKKILSLILAFVMTVSLVTTGFAAGFENFTKANTYEDGHFSDVVTGDWFAGSVRTAYEMGLVKGSSETTFNPKGNITVAETVALASRLHSIYNGGNGEFTQGTPWYQVYVDYATENGILREKYKSYDTKISRANFAFILIKALPADALSAINEVPDGTLPDVPDNYKAGAIYTLYRAGILTGNDEFGTFKPDSTITRAEVAAIITRMADKSQRKALALKRKATVSEEIYRGAIAYADSMFMQNYGMAVSEYLDQDMGGMTGAEVLKRQAFSIIGEFEAVRMFALDNDITLSENDRKELAAAKEAQYAAVGGREAFLKSLSESGLNEAFFDYFIESQLYYNKVTELFEIDGEYGASSEELVKVLSENYVRVKHILIQADSTSEDYETKKAVANTIAKKLERGEDFEKLLSEYGEDPGMITNPDGYIIDSMGYTPDGSQMISEFTEASVALKVDGVSAVVPSAYGFHIIKRYPMNKPFIESYIAENSETFMYGTLTNTISTYIAKVNISNSAELEAIDLKTIFN